MKRILFGLAVLFLVACSSVDQAKVENANKTFIEMTDVMNAGGDNMDGITAARDAYRIVKESLSGAEVKAHEEFIKQRADSLRNEQ